VCTRVPHLGRMPVQQRVPSAAHLGGRPTCVLLHMTIAVATPLTAVVVTCHRVSHTRTADGAALPAVGPGARPIARCAGRLGSKG
jgi:hypothetical protein